MSDKLLPCPFCSGEAIVVKTQKCGRYVMCLTCEVQTAEYETEYAGSAYDKAKAAWNRRADHSGEANGMIVEPDNEPTCGEKENFVQTKYGYCFYALDSNPLIYNLYVHPQYRRCGHSKGLLDLVINEVRKSGHKGEIHIQARPREGIGMEDLTMYYKRMGLSVCDRQKPEGGEGK